MVVLLAPLQLVIGDLHGLNTAKHQPAKVAAMEGHWDGTRPAPLLLSPGPTSERTQRREIGIPNLASLIITHRIDGLFPGSGTFRATSAHRSPRCSSRSA